MITTMNFQDLPIIEQLQLLRITADSQIPPHRFLFSWNLTRKEISDHEVYYLPGPNLAQTALNFGG